MMQNPIICAVDTPDIQTAEELAIALKGNVGALKLGLEFFTNHGSAGVEIVAAHKVPIFLDLKFHDIPNTVAGAVRGTAGCEAFMMTVHTAGGKEMLKAAVQAANDVADMTGKERPQVIGVTVLTSLDTQDLPPLGIQGSVQDQVKRLADVAMKVGLDGLVCSAKEIELLRSHCGPDITLVVPGIRPAGSPAGDQKRVMTPREALDLGADWLVIGRPITEAHKPAAAAREIFTSLR